MRGLFIALLVVSGALMAHGSVAYADPTPMADIYAALDIENLQTNHASYACGEDPTFSYDLVNGSAATLVIPENNDLSVPLHLVGILQHWIERLGPDKAIPSIPGTITFDGTKYAAGGENVAVDSQFPDSEWDPSESISFSRDLGPVGGITGFPSGTYRYHVEYKQLLSDGGAVIESTTVDFVYCPTSETLDIKPGSDINPINPEAEGLIPVAILGSDEFDVTNVDVATLTFGPCGSESASPHHAVGGHLKDVNNDGFTDLLSHYKADETSLTLGDTEACVVGELLDGRPFEGSDTVMIVPAGGRP